MLLAALLLQLTVAPDSGRVPAPLPGPAAPTPAYLALVRAGSAEDTTRPRAVSYSDFYEKRLTIHKWASWAMVPLFAGEYVVGQKLYRQNGGTEGGLRDTHQMLGTAIVGLFALNTATGAWNLWDARHDPNDRPRRWIHGISMLVATAGFAATSATGPGDDCAEHGGICWPNAARASTHRALAIGSASVATASWLMMLLWRN